MSIFASIMGKIFGSHKAADAPASAPGSTTVAAATGPASTAAGATTAPAGSVDIAAILDALNEKNPETLDWRKSIVDLMKLLGLDSSLTARKELASELHYAGDANDSASMNIWLHKEVMAKIAANGGKLPPDLTH
jgi:hypothetical protein